EAEENRCTRLVEAEPGVFQRAQIRGRDGEREGKLLRFRAAGIVHRPRIGGREGSGDTSVSKLGYDGRKRRSCLCPRQRAAAGSRHAPDRIKTDAKFARSRKTAFGPLAETPRSIVVPAEVELDGEGGRVDIFKHARERIRRGLDAVTVAADGAGEDQRESG